MTATALALLLWIDGQGSGLVWKAAPSDGHSCHGVEGRGDGLDGTPMSAYESLPAGALWALAAYVRAVLWQAPSPEAPPRAARSIEEP